MAGFIASDCPHCRTENVGFQILRNRKGKARYRFDALAECGNCRNWVILGLYEFRRSDVGPDNVEVLQEYFEIASVWPHPPKAVIPEHLPAAVEKPFVEAEDSLKRSSHAAVLLYRTAIERALKHLFPEEKGSLFHRIEAAGKRGDFAPSIVEWLHEVRVFGNDAAHDFDAEPTNEDAEAARDFTNLFLTYAYTMPERVRLAREKRAAAPPADG